MMFLADITPLQFLKMASSRLPDGYKNTINKYKYGMSLNGLDTDKPIHGARIAQSRYRSRRPHGRIINAENDPWEVRLKTVCFLAQPAFDTTRLAVKNM